MTSDEVTVVLGESDAAFDKLAAVDVGAFVDGAVLPSGENHPALSEVRQQAI